MGLIAVQHINGKVEVGVAFYGVNFKIEEMSRQLGVIGFVGSSGNCSNGNCDDSDDEDKCPPDSSLDPADGICRCMLRHCFRPICRPPLQSVLRRNGKKEPGDCCDVYECVSPQGQIPPTAFADQRRPTGNRNRKRVSITKFKVKERLSDHGETNVRELLF
ncbi:hypothetical protein RUM43_009504 [Polyplax serrata]|uniref:Uncharacterized protein n=1 Tax=Polyplax serrata TaxID=468196 RepID=A0AAN8NW75_POLSC